MNLLGKIRGKRKKPVDEAVRRLAVLRASIPDATDFEVETIQRVQPFTMTSPERLLGLIRAVAYIDQCSLPGSIVECGVWRGGSMMAAALASLHLTGGHDSQTMRPLWLFDTFEGMTEPGEADVDLLGNDAASLLDQPGDPFAADSVWCRSRMEDVQANLRSTGYPVEQLKFVPGPVEKTLEDSETGPIALLRLDTDWYESTRCELEQLFPRLVPGGVLIIDDYGHWQGCRQAVDEYFEDRSIRIFLQRMDYTGRLGVKQ